MLGAASLDRFGEAVAECSDPVVAVKAVQRLLARADARFSDLALPGDHSPRSSRPVHRVRAETLLQCGYPWNDWAERFLIGVTEWHNPLSDRQADILAEPWRPRPGPGAGRMTIPRRLGRSPVEQVEVDLDVLEMFADRLAEYGDPVRAGRALGMGLFDPPP